MGAIFYKAFSTGSAPYLTLASEEYLRPLGVGSSWTTLKVAVLCSITPNGVSNITGVNLAFGLCSGTARGYASASCLNGLYPVYSSGLTYTYTSNGGQNFYYSASATAAKVVNGVLTPGGGTPMTFGITGKRGVFLMTFTKGSPNFTNIIANVGGGSGGNYADDQTVRHAIEWCDTVSAGSPAVAINNVTTTLVGNSYNTAFDEVPGPLDTLDLYWGKAQFPLEIYGIFISRQA